MTEGMKLSTKTEAAPLLESESTGNNGALQLLADRYAKRLARISTRLVKKDKIVGTATVQYYSNAKAAVRALYADAT